MKNGSTQSQVFALAAALILAAVLASGCSSPPVQGNTFANQTPAATSYYPQTGTVPVAQAYYNCVNVMTAYGLQQQCYQVQTPYVTSYSQYSYAKTAFAKGVTDEMKQQAYASYLASVDAAAAADVKAQYDAIVAAYTK